MGIFSKLFGSDKVIDAGISGIDKAFYTKEERAEDELKRTNAKLLFMKAYEPFKIAQRFVAMIVGIPFAAIHVITSGAWIVTVFVLRENLDSYQFVLEQLNLISETNNKTLGEPFLWIIFFYFAGGAGEGIISKLSARAKK